MTRHKHAQAGLGTPSPLDRWIDATLRAFAMLVSIVAATFQMIRRPDRVNATRATPAVLPRETSDTIKETKPAAKHRSQIALMLRSAAKLRVSKHEGVLTAVSHTSPSPSVSHATRAIHLPLLRMGRQDQSDEGELPPSVRSTGGGGSPHSGLTEGASHTLRSSRRKSGPRASRVLHATGLRKQPWIPACAGTSGFLSPPSKNAAA